MSLVTEFLRLELRFSDLEPHVDRQFYQLRLFHRGGNVAIEFEHPSVPSLGTLRPGITPAVRVTPACRAVSNSVDLSPACLRSLKWFSTAGNLLPLPIRLGFANEVGGLHLTHEAEWACWLANICGGPRLSRNLFDHSDILIISPIEASVRASRLVALAGRGELLD